MMVGRRSFRSTCVHFQGWSLGKLHELPNLSFLKRIFSAQTKIQKKNTLFVGWLLLHHFSLRWKYIYILGKQATERMMDIFENWGLSTPPVYRKMLTIWNKIGEIWKNWDCEFWDIPLWQLLRLLANLETAVKGSCTRESSAGKIFHQFPGKQWLSPKETPTWWHNCTQSMINLGKTAILRQKFGIMMSVNSYSKW